MKKRLGLFIGEISHSYQKILANSVKFKANSLGYDVIMMCSYGAYTNDVLYALGESAIITLPDISMFDGIIVAEDVFDNPYIADELYKRLKQSAKCPVVYLRTTREGYYSILPRNVESMKKMVRHFTDDHGFTDICYMSGKQGYVDSAERLQAFLNVMSEHNIEVTKNMVFQGDYWRDKGKEAVDWFMQDRDTYPQAIICANDYMALSVCEELQKRGVRIPEDVCVSGFDYSEEAKVNIPSITSMKVDVCKLATKAVNIIDNVNNGYYEDKMQYIEADIVLHNSCGCGTQYNNKHDVVALLNEQYSNERDAKEVYQSVTDYQVALTVDDCLSVSAKYKYLIRAEKAWICMCDVNEKGYHDVENTNKFTDQIILLREFTKDDVKQCNIRFSKNKLLPDELWSEDEVNNICVFVLHCKDIVYGYVVTEFPKTQWFDIHTQGYFMTLANQINSTEIHQEIDELEVIRTAYEKDSLTGLYNRRGFDDKFNTYYSEAMKGNCEFGLASIDMDNLKYINDTFGHMAGDKALKTIARALMDVSADDDYCARVGGDEFSVLIMVTNPNRCMEFKNDFINRLKTLSKDIDDYDVSASIGICKTSENNISSSMSLQKIADERMYENKKYRKECGEIFSRDNIRH